MRNDPASQEELRLLYQVTISDLSYFKTSQWSVANYCMLSYAALIGIATILPPPLSLADRLLLLAFGLAACLSAVVILRKLQHSIRVRQARLDSIRDSMSSAFSRAWSAEYKPRERLHAVHLLIVAAPAAFGLLVWVIDSVCEPPNASFERKREG